MRNIDQNIERMVAARVIDAALAAGYAVSVFDGEETPLKCSRDKDAILAAMFSTDEDYLLLHRPWGDGDPVPETRHEREHFAWIRCIYGNCGWEVVNDWTTNIDALMDPIIAWCNDIQDGKVAIDSPHQQALVTELLAALRPLVNAADAGIHSGTVLDAAIAAARAAIAKAEGRS